mgnify:CR=1 FL=1
MMHHFSYVRFNEVEHNRKFQGHPCYKYMENKTYYNNIRQFKQYNIVDDVFNIIPYWKREFYKYLNNE